MSSSEKKLFDIKIIEDWVKALVAKYLLKDGPITGTRVHEGLTGSQKAASANRKKTESRNVLGE